MVSYYFNKYGNTSFVAYRNLLFFGKDGHQINATYDEATQLWTVPIFFKESSVRIIETECVYVMEKFLFSGQVKIGYPHAIPSLATKLNVVTSPNDVQIGLFAVINHLDSQPTFLPATELVFDLDVVGGDSIDITTGLVQTTIVRESSIRIDLFTNSNIEGVFDNNIKVSDDKGQQIILIQAHSEIEGQDERMDAAQSRLSRQIAESLEYIFRDSDINEDLPNYKLLNRKKKQFVAQHQHILPYISSIRGLISFIRYFGYYDLRIKEHWKNVETNKLQLRELQLDATTDVLDRADNIPAYPYVRVPELGLYYDIVRPRADKKLDENGLPLTEKTFSYSIEEILIKLFGLKKYLEEEDVTGIARIVDIVGQYDIFERTKINAWETNTETLVHDYVKVPSFTVDKNFDYINDLRSILNTYVCTLPIDWTVGTSSSDPIGENRTCWIGYFSPFNRNAPEFIDEPNIPVGKLINLLNTSFFQPWNDISISWADSAKNNLTITWANIDKLNYYEVEWIITYSNVNEVKKTFQFKQRNKATILSQEVILPYFGMYDVTLKIYGFDGEIAALTQNSFLQIYPKNPDFISFYRLYESELQIWRTNYLKWSDIWNEWREKIYDNSRYKYDGADIQYKSMMTVRYLDLAYLGINSVGIADETWDTHSDASWNDHKYLSWLYTRFDKERPSNFEIQTLHPNGILQIGNTEFQFPSDLNAQDWIRAAKLLNNTNDGDISNYYYVARPLTAPSYIDAVSKFDGRNGERWIGASNSIVLNPNQRGLKWVDCKNFHWTDIPIHWKNSFEIYFAKALENPFTFDNIKVYSSTFEVPTVVPVLMTIDNCTIAGKTDAFWSIIDEFDDTIVDRAEGKYFAYSFERPGYYSVKLTIVDTNGNEYTNMWKNRVRVMKPLDYMKQFYLSA